MRVRSTTLIDYLMAGLNTHPEYHSLDRKETSFTGDP